MKQKLQKIVTEAAQTWAPLPPFEMERPKVREHGELATNLAMLLAKKAGLPPQKVAQQIMDHLKDEEGMIESVSMAGAGFLNFVLKKKFWQESLREIHGAGERFGCNHDGQGKKVNIEFVSANPTGPLHIGNARGGPLGDALASLLEASGYQVVREYYINDVGGQIDKLGASILYWIKNAGRDDVLPPEGYQGDYVKELAQEAVKTLGKKIENKKEEDLLPILGRFGMDTLLKEIQRDCADMMIRFDSWVSERTLLVSKETDKILEQLKEKKVTLEKEGAIWLAPNDEFTKDRECVLVRSDGRPTYFANDITYHVQKYRAGFDRMINVWGSNHHGHVPRAKAANQCLGLDPEKIETVLYQYVRVKRGNEAVKMSKRGGNFVTAREVLDEVGKDAVRFFLLMRAPESHLDCGLERAKSQSQENPVYYVQYAYARLCAIERKALEQKIPPLNPQSVNLALLDLPEEIEMIRKIHEYPEEISRAAARLEPHRIPFYLVELAKMFQSYYTKAREDVRYRVLSTDVDTSHAKMYLCATLKQILAQGLKLLGVSAPEVMVSPPDLPLH
ncbi:MAG: arginine--tRNA ligase [Deltaproteobacteria bacterium]|nr:arginine--tRNA ligase [Deltaproteobacteria bacterium]